MLSDDFSLAEMSARIHTGDLSSVGAVTGCLERIAKLDDRIQAWTTVDTDAALRQAETCDVEHRRGRPLGPLHGVPIGVKDIFMTRGLRTTMGSPLFDGHVPDHDASVISRLKDAGAIILGKTVTAEFAALDPGPTRNPWNAQHTPGGSSSGSAAAVAAGMCPAATGTQTAASIGRPAAFCGIVGMMPTASRIPRDGVFPAAWSLDHVGAFGRCVQDVSIMVAAMSGETLSESHVPAIRDVRVGIVTEYFHENTDSEAWALHERFIEQLRASGANATVLVLPEIFRIALPALRTIMRAELAAVHETLYCENPTSYGSNLRGMVEAGRLISATEYLRACRLRHAYRNAMRDLFRTCDVILSPGARGAAPEGIHSTGDPALSIPWTLADLPTLSLPLALTQNRLPVGIQLTAPCLAEDRLIAIGRSVERFVKFQDHPLLG